MTGLRVVHQLLLRLGLPGARAGLPSGPPNAARTASSQGVPQYPNITIVYANIDKQVRVGTVQLNKHAWIVCT